MKIGVSTVPWLSFKRPRRACDLPLVSAFAGYDTMRAAYRHAIERRYRFFSYGDAMLLTCSNNA